MAKSTWPTYSDVSTYFSEVGINLPSSGSVTDYVSEVVGLWNSAVGFTFLSDGSSGVTYYDSPQLGTLQIPYHSSISNVSVNGTNLTLNTDYWIRNSREIIFNSHYSWKPNAVAVTGVLGYTTIPVEVWKAVMSLVAWKVIYANPQRNFQKLKQKFTEITFNDPKGSDDDFYRLAKSYRY